MAKPSLLDRIDSERMYKHVEQALTSRLGFQRDRDYVVVDDKIVIVDESTGRQMEGRKWQDGLHQAVEAKELVPITAATGQAARVTVQTYFRQYEHLCGMTGTAVQARRELRRDLRDQRDGDSHQSSLHSRPLRRRGFFRRSNPNGRPLPTKSCGRMRKVGPCWSAHPLSTLPRRWDDC